MDKAGQTEGHIKITMPDGEEVIWTSVETTALETYDGPYNITENGTLATSDKKLTSNIVVDVPAPVPTLIEKNIAANGTYIAASDNADGYSEVNVNVPIPQPTLVTKSITQNGTYNASSDNADGYSSVTVDVPTPQPTLVTKTITENGTYNASGDNADGYSSVTVDVEGSADLNIYFSPTVAPTDTSKLWVKSDEPSDVLIVARDDGQNGRVDILRTNITSNERERVGYASVGTKMYLFGGRAKNSTSTVYNDIRVFDIETNTFSTLSTTLSDVKYGISAASVGTKIYLFGGAEYTTQFISNSNTIQVFDTETNTLSTLSATLPLRMQKTSSISVGTKIYLFGGYGSSDGINSHVLDLIMMFDTETNTLSTLSATLPTAISEIGCASVGTKIYLFGGWAAQAKVDTIQMFNTETNTISTLSTTLSSPTTGIGCASIGTKIYLFGGMLNSMSSVIQIFDTDTESLSMTWSLNVVTAYLYCLSVGTKIYFVNDYASRNIGVYEYKSFPNGFALIRCSTSIQSSTRFVNIVPNVQIAPVSCSFWTSNGSVSTKTVAIYDNDSHQWVNIISN